MPFPSNDRAYSCIGCAAIILAILFILFAGIGIVVSAHYLIT